MSLNKCQYDILVDMIIIPMGLLVFMDMNAFHFWEPQGTKCYWRPLQKHRTAAFVWDVSQAAPSSMREERMLFSLSVQHG